MIHLWIYQVPYLQDKKFTEELLRSADVFKQRAVDYVFPNIHLIYVDLLVKYTSSINNKESIVHNEVSFRNKSKTSIINDNDAVIKKEESVPHKNIMSIINNWSVTAVEKEEKDTHIVEARKMKQIIITITNGNKWNPNDTQEGSNHRNYRQRS